MNLRHWWQMCAAGTIGFLIGQRAVLSVSAQAEASAASTGSARLSSQPHAQAFPAVPPSRGRHHTPEPPARQPIPSHLSLSSEPLVHRVPSGLWSGETAHSGSGAGTVSHALDLVSAQNSVQRYYSGHFILHQKNNLVHELHLFKTI